MSDHFIERRIKPKKSSSTKLAQEISNQEYIKKIELFKNNQNFHPIILRVLELNSLKSKYDANQFKKLLYDIKLELLKSLRSDDFVTFYINDFMFLLINCSLNYLPKILSRTMKKLCSKEYFINNSTILLSIKYLKLNINDFDTTNSKDANTILAKFTSNNLWYHELRGNQIMPSLNTWLLRYENIQAQENSNICDVLGQEFKCTHYKAIDLWDNNKIIDLIKLTPINEDHFDTIEIFDKVIATELSQYVIKDYINLKTELFIHLIKK